MAALLAASAGGGQGGADNHNQSYQLLKVIMVMTTCHMHVHLLEKQY